ncbi:hypothetical protein FACS189413_01350 [Bacteroidia bacterium]|nr:hypothetical protein FACS189413_01350 [Bacteroidia bacterium]
MKRVKFFTFAVFTFVLFMMTSCDEATTITIPLEGMEFDIPLVVDVEAAAKSSLRADELVRVPFTGSYTLNLADPMFEPIRQHIEDNSKIKFVVTSVLMTLEASLKDELEFNVYDFNAKFESIYGSGEFSLSQPVKTNQKIEDPEMTAFINNFLTAVLSHSEVTIFVSGLVDQEGVEAAIAAGQTALAFAKFFVGLEAQIDVANTISSATSK